MNKLRSNREPLFHIVKRGALPWYRAWGIRLFAILLALIVCAIITAALTGVNPLELYAKMFEGAFGTKRRVWTLLQNLSILLCVAVAVTPGATQPEAGTRFEFYKVKYRKIIITFTIIILIIVCCKSTSHLTNTH